MKTERGFVVSRCSFLGKLGTPHAELWDERTHDEMVHIDNGMAHIDLTRDRDAILIAPASADFIAKLVHGIADDLLSTLCLARACPLLVAPAMNRQMWEHPATQRNIHQLKRDGVTVLGPASGAQACAGGMGHQEKCAEPGRRCACHLHQRFAGRL